MASATADFERIYRRHARDVYRFALSVVRNPLEAEDVTQTTFLNAYRALERGDRPERPRSWLFAIAHNAIRSRDRWTLRRPREVPLDTLEQWAAAAPEEPQLVEDLLQALRELPRSQREALALRELQGQSYPEIAETLGVSVAAVESLLGRARRTLRAQLENVRGVAVLRWLVGQGDAGGNGVAAKAAVVVGAATALAGGMAAETHVAGPPAHAASIATPALSMPAVVAAVQRPAAVPRPPASASAPTRSRAPAMPPAPTTAVRAPAPLPAGGTTAAPPPAPAPVAAATAAVPQAATTTAAAVTAPGRAATTTATTAAATASTVANAASGAVAATTTAAAAVVTTVASVVRTASAPAATVTTPAVATPVATATRATVTTPTVTVPTVTLPPLPPPPGLPGP